jgi:Flp pilus assembly protein TadD
MKNSFLLSAAISKRAIYTVTGLLLLAGASACTTTSQRVSDNTRPVTLSSTAPGAASELRIADTALESGNMEMATTLYNKVADANPKSVPAITGLGNTLYAVGDFTRAGVNYQRASAIDPTASAPLIGIARVAIHQRRFDDAIAAYRKVLTVTPDDSIACAGLGAALDMKGDHVGAQAELRRALVANPGDPLISVNLGLSLVLSGHPREGANVLLDVTHYPSAPAQARQDLALAYGLLGNDDAAAEILRKDLPKASVQDNLRYYKIQRDRLAVTPANGATVSSVGAAPIQAASLR